MSSRPASPSVRTARQQPFTFTFTRGWGAVASAALLLVGCATATPASRPSVGLLLRGPPEAVSSARAALPAADLPVLLQPLELPGSAAAAPAAPPVLEETLAAARKGYVDADFSRCLAALEAEALVPDALARGARTLAARVLLWRAACHAGAGRTPLAQRSARELAVLGLELPPDVGSVTPDVEALLVRELKEVAKLRTYPLRVSSDAPSAELTLDGRSNACSTPCTLEAPEGQHMLRVEADGTEPVVKKVRFGPEERALHVPVAPASPALAGAQWSARYGRGAEVDSAASLKLLATALRAPRLVLVSLEPERSQTRLRGVVAVEGAVAARAERPAEPDLPPAALEGLLRDLLVKGQVVEPSPALWQRPAFWVALGGVAALAAGTTALVVTRRVRTGVTF